MPAETTGQHSWYSNWSPNRPRRRSSNALPHRESSDRFEKSNRHTSSGSTLYHDSMQDKLSAAWMNSSPRLRAFRIVGAVLIIFTLIWVFTPPQAKSMVEPGWPGKPAKPIKDNKGGQDGSQPLPVPVQPVKPAAELGQTASDATTGTTKCTHSYSKDKPIVQYALMVDAGSTGSRIHVYRFNNCGPTPELEDEVFMMTAKREGGSGLSAYKGDPEAAAKSLDVLLDKAVESVPEKLQGCTPIAVKATAGLRKIGPEASEAILKAVRARLENHYPFPLVSEANGGVEVMDGKDEGVYAWITTNYLLGKIGGPDKTPTAAVFDLGGGSTQIVFQPTFPDAPAGGMPEQMQEGDHKYALSFGGRDFTLYQHSYLGYGLMEARNNLHKVVVENLYETTQSKAFLSAPITNACIAPGMWKEIEVSLGKGHALGETVTVNMTGPAEGAPAQCRGLAEKTLKKEAECKIAPCAFNGVHQPSLEKTFAREDVYLFSYFYDRLQPLGMPESFTLDELRSLTARVCDGMKSIGSFATIDGATKELSERPDTCLDLNFMFALLHTGYEMPIGREVKIAKKIKGNELGWCLGASLPLLSQESGWKCKIKQVA